MIDLSVRVADTSGDAAYAQALQEEEYSGELYGCLSDGSEEGARSSTPSARSGHGGGGSQGAAHSDDGLNGFHDCVDSASAGHDDDDEGYDSDDIPMCY